MSRLEKLGYNPWNYKNLCNVFEADPDACLGCYWNKVGFVCSIPIYDRAELMEVLFNVTS